MSGGILPYQNTNPTPAPSGGIDSSAAIGAGLNIIGGVIQGEYNKKAQEKQNKYNRKQWEDTNAYNLEQWMRNNQYNSPLEQMARLKGAGLNPNMVYGTGTQAAGQSSGPTKASPITGQVKASQVGAAIGGGLSSYMQIAQINNLNAQTAKIIEDTKTKAVGNVQTTTTRLESIGHNRWNLVTIAGTRNEIMADNKIKQQELGITQTQMNNQMIQYKNALMKYNITVTDDIILRQMVLNLGFGKASEQTKRTLLTAAGMGGSILKSLGKAQ